MKMLLAFSLLAISAQAGPILMSGSGSWQYVKDDGGYASVGASGDAATISFTGVGLGNWQDLTTLFGATINCGYGCQGYGFAAIGTVESSYFEFRLDGTNSWLRLYTDRSGTEEIASIDLVAYLQVTSEEMNYNNGILQWSTGTFAVLSTPEPGTAWMAVLGATALLCLRQRRSSHKTALAAARRA